MLVVLSIIGFVTAVALVGQQSFTRSVLVANTAYDVAITLRHAEVYGISSNKGQGNYLAGHGIDLKSASATTFNLFDDIIPTANSGSTQLCFAQPNGALAPNAKPGNCLFDSGDSTTNVYTLGNGLTIKNVCAKRSSDINSPYCWNNGTTIASQIDVVFARPNTKATIVASNVGTWPPLSGVTAGGSALGLDSVCLTLQGPGTTPILRYIYITAVGQVAVSAISCP